MTPSRPSVPRLAYSVREAAEILGVSHKSVRELVWSGQLRHRRLSDRADGRGKIVIPASAIKEWLNADGAA
jgi:excisionase family DNA binding protein